MKLRIAIQMTALVTLGGGFAGCGELLTSSRLITSDPFEGKGWSETAYLEPDVENPSEPGDSDSSGDPAVRGFEGQQVPGADDFWLAASFFNRTSGQFEGYARRYQPGPGWAAPGDEFQVVASADGFSAGAAQISIDASGGVLAAYIEDDDGGAVTRMMTSYRSTSWKSFEVQSLGAAADLPGLGDAASLIDDAFGLAGGWPMDLLLSSERPGVGYLFGAQVPASAPVLSGAHWSASSGFDSDLVHTDRDITLSTTGDASPVLIREDSGGGFCLFTEGPDITDSSISVIHAHCSAADSLLLEDFADGTTLGDAFSPAANSAIDASITGNESSSGLVDAAFDGVETLLAVFYRDDEDGASQLYSRARVGGVWEDYLVQITSAVNAAYTTPFEKSFPIRPAVAALSESRFLVVWPGYDFSNRRASLFYATRDEEGAWSRPSSMGLDFLWPEDGNVDSGGSNSVLDGLWLSSNRTGEAALAVRYLGDETSDMSDLSEVPRKWVFARYSEEAEAWDTAAIRSRPGYDEDGLVGCVPAEVGLNHCTQPPSGAVFSDGSAVLVFPMEDNEKRARLGTVTYQ